MTALRRIVITGGAGFVGSHLAIALKQQWSGCDIIAFDNLHRRGSELTLQRLREAGVIFHHGDVRVREDISQVGAVDLMLDCSAEPSVHAGYADSPAYLVNTNLVGLVNCLEHLRLTGGDLWFLSTSRVYPIAALRALPLVAVDKRLQIVADQVGPGWSVQGVAEEFPMAGSRSLYGTTKFAAELLIEEYRAMYRQRAIINRAGVIAGPWQMGKVDQGFVALWVARHRYGGRLTYSGFGGEGLQVRDVLHVRDLCALCLNQIVDFERYDGGVYNVGGGNAISTSLRELTDLCRQVTGQTIEIDADPTTRAADIPYYVSDCSALHARAAWRATSDVGQIVEDIDRWLVEERHRVQTVFTS
jgi:CDP-paratose 2-epimerase